MSTPQKTQPDMEGRNKKYLEFPKGFLSSQTDSALLMGQAE